MRNACKLPLDYKDLHPRTGIYIISTVRTAHSEHGTGRIMEVGFTEPTTHLPGGTQHNHKTLQDSRYPSRDSNHAFPQDKY
jgi:hypothetical protein